MNNNEIDNSNLNKIENKVENNINIVLIKNYKRKKKKRKKGHQ